MGKILTNESGAISPTLGDAFKVWAKIGFLSFGGPAAQISLMHRIIVDENKWLTEKQFLNALSFCMLLPGPEAMQLAIYAGWRLHGVVGGLIAGLLFVLPGAFVVLALAEAYVMYGTTEIMSTVFLGIKSAVLVIVIEALFRVSKKALIQLEYWLIAGVAFIAIFFLALPYPLIVLLSAFYGFVRLKGDDFKGKVYSTPAFHKTLTVMVFWLGLWLVPLYGLMITVGQKHILSEIGMFFSKLAVVTFGGAYAVLAYMGQDVVITHGWLEASQMIDGLGLAETTPGPLILVTEFVGYLSAYQHENNTSWLLGLAGAAISLWATFVPCFLWIFTGAPYIEWINSQPRLKGALSGILAAVVGVILNLSVWFSLHVFFKDLEIMRWGLVNLWIPDLATLNLKVVLLASISGFLLLKWHWKIPSVLCVASLLSVLIGQI